MAVCCNINVWRSWKQFGCTNILYNEGKYRCTKQIGESMDVQNKREKYGCTKTRLNNKKKIYSNYISLFSCIFLLRHRGCILFLPQWFWGTGANVCEAQRPMFLWHRTNVWVETSKLLIFIWSILEKWKANLTLVRF